ncbi:MAG: tetratricopeptide repeat protein [Candidatus Diapherotrites archaeon]|nr:tetratricopeptide repeat protein [Candidatus Diapherotrites archaeon]
MNDIGLKDSVFSDKSLLIKPVALEMTFFAVLAIIFHIPVWGTILGGLVAVIGVLLMSFNTYRICKKSIQEHGFNFSQSVLLAFTQALIVATFFLFFFTITSIAFYEIVYPNYFPTLMEDTISSLGQEDRIFYESMGYETSSWFFIITVFFLFIPVLAGAVLYRVLLALVISGMSLQAKPASARIMVLAGITVLAVVILDSGLTGFVLFSAGQKGVFEALGNMEENGYPGFGDLFGSGFKEMELLDGKIEAYEFDRDYAYFSIAFRYNKSSPKKLDLKSLNLVKEGKGCTTVLFQRISRSNTAGHETESIFAENQEIELLYRDTLTIQGVLGGTECGMTQQDFNYNLFFTLTGNSGTTNESGRISGNYYIVETPDAGYYETKAFYNWQTGSYTASEENYLKAIELEPYARGYVIDLKTMYFEAEEYEKAAAFIDTVIARFSNEIELQYAGGRAYHQIGNYEKAREYLENTLELDSEHNGAKNLLFETYLAEKDYGNGKAKAYALLAGTPNDPDLYYYLGVFSVYQEDYAMAEENFEKCLELDADAIGCLDWLASAYANQEKYSETKETAEKGLEYYPEEPRFLYWLGVGQYYTGSIEEAISNLEKSLESEPTNAMAWLVLSYAYSDNKENEKAQEALRKYEELQAN